MTKIRLADDDIHIWLVKPQQLQQPQLLERYQQLLTEAETERQQRYLFAKDRHESLIARALVRTTLSKYLDGAPADWRFEKGEKGKPNLPGAPLQFNLSHTDGLIALGITKQQPLGVDVEYLKRKSETVKIAHRYFSPTEVEALNQQPSEQQRNRFFDYWTLKESYIKACGLGLAIPLDHFTFHIQGQNDIDLSFVPERDDDPAQWQSWLRDVEPEHRLAISIKAPTTPRYNLRFFEVTPLVGFEEMKLEASY